MSHEQRHLDAAREFRETFEYKTLGGPMFKIEDDDLWGCALKFEAALAALLAETEAAGFRAGVVESREYLAILCGMRHWKKLRDEDALALSRAAQSIVNEFAEHFTVALDIEPLPAVEQRVSDERADIIERRVIGAETALNETRVSTPDRRKVPDNDILDLLHDLIDARAEIARLRATLTQALDDIEHDGLFMGTAGRIRSALSAPKAVEAARKDVTP